MSCDWDIYCRTCDARAGFCINHGDDTLADLISHQPIWSALAGVTRDIDMRVLGDENCGMSGWPEFARAHLGHDVALRDEYGGFRDECSEWIDCGTCGHRQARCKLKPGHDGEHSPNVHASATTASNR